jgi:hypothetical protein
VSPFTPKSASAHRGRRTFAALVAAGVVVSMAAVAAPAGATGTVGSAPTKAVLKDVSFNGTSTTVTSSSHTKLVVEVEASAEQGSAGSVSVELATPSFGESHDWSFQVPASAISIGAGKGSIKVPAASIAPYGTVSLKFSSAGKARKHACSAANYDLEQKVKVTGTFYFDSRSSGKHKWGHVGSKTKKFAFRAGSEIDRTYGSGGFECENFTEPCASGTSFDAASPDFSVFIDGGSTGRHGSLSIERSTSLSAPAGAERNDFIEVAASAPKAKALGGGKERLTVSAPKRGAASGSFTLTATGKGKASSQTCKAGKHKRHEKVTTWESTNFTNGKKPISFHEAIFGPLTEATSTGNAGFTITKA